MTALKRLQTALRESEPQRGSTLVANWYREFAARLVNSGFFDSLPYDTELMRATAAAFYGDLRTDDAQDAGAATIITVLSALATALRDQAPGSNQ